MHRILALLLLVAPLAAKNVDLVTLPSRDTVQLTIYNSEDLTLVKETRHVTLRKGSNQLQFSWANTLIDPTSVTLRPLQHAGEVEIADTVFPGQKPQHLIWNVESGIDGQIAVEVSYFTSGLTWTMDYVGVCDAAETVMDFDGYVRVFNRSGEEYENASVRLIVGKINLVEQIAELARRQGIPMPKPGEPRYRDLRKEAGLRVAAVGQSLVDDGTGRWIAVVHDPEAHPTLDLDGFDVLLHGHHHRRVVERVGGTLVFNPGECAGWLEGRNAVGVLDLEVLEAEVLLF